MHPLQFLIYKHGYTITEFAHKCGINRSTLYKHFTGESKTLRCDLAMKISETLHEPYEKIVSLLEGV